MATDTDTTFGVEELEELKSLAARAGFDEAWLADELSAKNVGVSTIRLDEGDQRALKIVKVRSDFTPEVFKAIKADLAVFFEAGETEEVEAPAEVEAPKYITPDAYNKVLARAMQVSLDTDWLDAKIEERGGKTAPMLQAYKVTYEQLAEVDALLSEIIAGHLESQKGGKAKPEAPLETSDAVYKALQKALESAGDTTAEKWLQERRAYHGRDSRIADKPIDIFAKVRADTKIRLSELAQGVSKEGEIFGFANKGSKVCPCENRKLHGNLCVCESNCNFCRNFQKSEEQLNLQHSTYEAGDLPEIREDVFVSDAEMESHRSRIEALYDVIRIDLMPVMGGPDRAIDWVKSCREKWANKLQIGELADEIIPRVRAEADALRSVATEAPKPEEQPVNSAETGIPTESGAQSLDDKPAKGKRKAAAPKEPKEPKPKKEKPVVDLEDEINYALDNRPENYLRHQTRYQDWQLYATEVSTKLEEDFPGLQITFRLFGNQPLADVHQDGKPLEDVTPEARPELCEALDAAIADLHDRANLGAKPVCIHVVNYIKMKLRGERELKELKANYERLKAEAESKATGGQFVYGPDLNMWAEGILLAPSNIDKNGNLKKKSITTIAGVIGYRQSGGVKLSDKDALVADLLKRYEAANYDGDDEEKQAAAEVAQFELASIPVEFEQVNETRVNFDWSNGLKPLVVAGVIDLAGVEKTEVQELGTLYIEPAKGDVA